MSFLDSFLDTIDPGNKEERFQKRYDQEKTVARSSDVIARLKLANSAKTQAEILYYLAQHDDDVSVRTAVAANAATPYQANRVIIADKDADVRLALADRLVKLLPHLPNDKQSQLHAYTVEALEALAGDEVIKIRIALAQTLAKELHAPAHIVNKLAQDIERQVAEPILHHCMAVSDDVLLEILSNHPAGWAVEAISQRKYVSALVSDAVIEAENEQAGTFLLENVQADISPPTLFKIAEKSRAFVTWQRPLAVRAFLPADASRKLAEFVDESVRKLLVKRADLDEPVSNEIGKKFRSELNQLEREDHDRMSPEDRVRKMIVDGALNEDALIAALDKRDRVFAIVALAALVRTSRSSMENIIGAAKPKAIIAVCARAGLSMRTCLRIQKEIAVLPSKELIYPRGGTDYPLDAEEIKWQLDFLGLA